MKKIILIASVSILGLSITAFGFINWNGNNGEEKDTACCSAQVSSYNALYPMDKVPNPNFAYSIGSRFIATITKEEIENATSIIDLLPEGATTGMEAFRNVRLTVFNDDGEAMEYGKNEMLNEAQIRLLRNRDYSTDFYIRADCKNMSDYSNQMENYDLVYYVSIVPEKEAQFKDGKQALIDYLKKNSVYETADISEKDLKPGRLHFVVSKNGTIENIQLESSSGHENIDLKMEELIRSVSGYWESAMNSKGEKIEQEFVFAFGVMGC